MWDLDHKDSWVPKVDAFELRCWIKLLRVPCTARRSRQSILNWRLITLQFVVVLPYIDMNQPWMYMCSPSWTPIPPPTPSHPSGSSQCTSPEHPVSCIEPGLVICFTYDNIYVSMLFSQIIPPLPSPTESKRLFYTSVFLLLPCM